MFAEPLMKPDILNITNFLHEIHYNNSIMKSLTVPRQLSRCKTGQFPGVQGVTVGLIIRAWSENWIHTTKFGYIV
jgi:hypothetical protein